MAILNYTTKVKAEQTASEIQALLGSCGANAVMSEYENNEIIAVSFQYELNKRIYSFRLPINADGVLKALHRDKVKTRYKNESQAKRTAWRIIKDWIEAQLALVEANQADVVEVFLPYMQDQTGDTIYKKIKSGDLKMLGTSNRVILKC